MSRPEQTIATNGIVILAFCLVATGGCSGHSDAPVSKLSDSVESPMVVIQPADLGAYRSGVAREIALRREAEGLGFLTRPEMVDSAAADAAGLSIERYRVLVGHVEGLLARGPRGEPEGSLSLSPEAEPMWNRMRLGLDSLRLEAMVLRAKTGS